MSDERQPQVTKFSEQMEKWLENGLVDVKFFVGDVSESTMESFCREANAIEEALNSKNYKQHDWQGNKQFLLG